MRYFYFLPLLGFLACHAPSSEADMEEVYKQEIMEVERAFAAMAKAEGVPKAFAHFAADDVVMSRGKRLIMGKEEMRDYFADQTLTDVTLTWEPAFVGVSTSGDLAYTYGPYGFAAMDTSGVRIEDEGYFHTVWRRQPDGQWKFVWD